MLYIGHFVYKYVFKGQVIYIGKNNTDLKSRLSSHGKPGDNIDEVLWEEINNADIYYLEFENAIVADVVESILISKYNPKGNKAKKNCDFNKYRIKYDEHEEDWQIYKIAQYNKIDEKEKRFIDSKLYNCLIKKYNLLKEKTESDRYKVIAYEDYVKLISEINEYLDVLVTEKYFLEERKNKHPNALNKERCDHAFKELNRFIDSFGKYFYDYPKERTAEESIINIRNGIGG